MAERRGLVFEVEGEYSRLPGFQAICGKCGSRDIAISAPHVYQPSTGWVQYIKVICRKCGKRTRSDD